MPTATSIRSALRVAGFVGIGALVVVLAFLLLVTKPRLERELERSREAHEATIAAVELAQAKSEAADRANADRVRTEQQSITEEIVHDYQGKIADVRARADAFDRRLRAAGTAAAAGVGPAPHLPDAGDAPGRAVAAPGEDRLPAAPTLTLPDALVATEQALQLDALIDWIEAQHDVRFSAQEATDGKQ